MRIFILIYVIVAAILSLVSVFLETYPARFIIDLFAPHPGDKYPLQVTFLFTFLALLIPVVIPLFIIKLVRNRNKTPKGSVLDNDDFTKNGMVFTRQKQLQSGLISSPIFINGEKRGKIDSGKTLFIELLPGTYEVEAGQNSQKSDKLTVLVEPGRHTRVDIHIVAEGLKSKYVVEVV